MVLSEAGGAAGSGHYRFGDIVVDEAARSLLRAGVVQPLEPKAFTVLLALLRRPGELIGRDALLDAAWGHRHVTPGVLTRAIAQLRSALGDDPQQPRYIQTRHALGYCFIGALESNATVVLSTASGPAPAPAGSAGADRGSPGAAAQPQRAPEPTALVPAPSQRWSRRTWALAAALAAAVALGMLVWSQWQPRGQAEASIAILPFTNLGAGGDDDYFAEGLAVELHDALTGVRGLKVAAQMSPAAARSSDARELGKLLGVATVLDASVRRDGRRLRINARLSDCATGFTLWSRSYDRELSDVFATQKEIALDVVRSLSKVLPSEEKALSERLMPTRNLAAFDAYLRGLQRLRRSENAEDVAHAVSLFEQALAEDRGLAAAQAGICRSELWRFSNLREAAALDRAADACLQSEAMAPGWRRIDLLIGDIHRHRGELVQARERYDRARSDPGLLADVLLGEGALHAAQGDTEQALAAFEAARVARPGDGGIIGRIGFQQFRAGRLQEAIASYGEAARLRPDDAGLWASLGGIYLNVGRNEEALEAFERSLAIEPTALAYYNRGVLLFYLGDYAAAATSLHSALRLESGDFRTWGALGAALLADASTAAAAAEPFRRARELAVDFLRVDSGDAFAHASHGWYSAVLGDAQSARGSALAAEAIDQATGEVSLLNAQTFTLVGNRDDVALRLQRARVAGVAESRISNNPFVGDPAFVAPLRAAGRPAGAAIASVSPVGQSTQEKNDDVPD
ncbi:winged helix-turn-helix domain-containing tetratricopeptide repeat protein [Luteimonas salinilitoris]|uniref:Winged helix-turn-helix domain-containing tetratricopeptide repeat protein n=1 Tax=Luteimonas salinilitoris TaxID=3237697 RepID=A0ABV4HXD8_9GAMM